MRITSNAPARGFADFLRDAAGSARTGSRNPKWDAFVNTRTNWKCTGMSVKTEAPVEIKPAVNVPGFMLRCGRTALWFAMEIYAVNHARDLFRERDIVVFNPDESVKHRYSGGNAR